MAVYTLSPSERRARAQAVKARRENRYSYSNYIEEQKKAATAQADAVRQAQIDEENEKKNQSFIVRGLSTIGDLAANVITGAVKGLESIYDLGAGVVGGIGGIFDKDFQNSVQEHIAYDWTTETIGNPLQELTKYSYLKNGGTVEKVANAVGGMLPYVAATVVTGGLGAPAAVAQGAGLATLGVSAAGSATEQAYNDGAGYWQGLGYGVASGAVEVATEKLGGGLTGNVFGRGFLDGVGKTVADTGFKRIVKGALEEGAEEVIAELANPALKSIYKGKSAFEDYKDPEYWKGVGEAGLVGGLTALAYGGTVGRVVNSARGINEDISESIAQVETLERKRNNLFADDRLTQQTDTKIADGIRANYQNVETALKKASEKNRTKFIKTYRLSEAFDTDGSMKPEFAARIGITQNSQNAANTGETVQADTDANGAAQTPLASLDTRYYHPSLRGQEQRITEQLAKQGTRVFSGELTETERVNYSKFKKAFNALSQRGLVQPDFVIAESSDNFYSYLDGKTVVLGKDALESDVWQQKIIHEVEHFTEGTKEWADFASFVFNETDTSTAIQSILRKNYGITQADVDNLPTALAEGNLTDNQRLLVSEVVAEQSEVLLGNEQTIQRLATTKRSLARKLYDRIKNFIKVLKVKTPEEKTVIKKLEKAQQLFEKALDKAGAKYIASQVDSESETQYNRKRKKGTPYNQYRTLAMQWAYSSQTSEGDTRILYNAQDNTWNKIVANNSDEGFGVLQSVKDTPQNQRIIDELFREVKNESNAGEQRDSQVVYEDIGRFETVRRGGQNDNDNASKREADGRTRGVHQEEHQRNGGGDSRQGGGNQQYSLKVGNETITGAVEESGRLVALHNLSEEKLLKVLQLGGFPMPSIAITRADIAHDQFGDITVIFGKDTIDPQRSTANRVFSRDGYTPTVPKVDYKVNERVGEKIRKKYYELARKYGYDTLRPMYKYGNNLDDVLDSVGGEAAMLSEIYDNTDIMQIFLLDTKGQKIEPVYREARENMSDEQVAYQEKFISAIGRDVIEALTPPKGKSIPQHRKDWLAQNKNKLVDFFARELYGGASLNEGRATVLQVFSDQDLIKQVLAARNYLHNGRTTTRTEYDSSATQEAVRNAVSQEEYRAWVDSLFGGVEEKQGIRNDKDPFTPSGSRRSFEATHDDYTLENLVRAMKKAPAKGNGGFVSLTVNELAAKLAKEFKSVSEIRKNAVSLKAFNQEVHDNFVDTARGMINEIESLLLPQSSTERMTDWSLLDGASLIIGEIADKGYSTEKQIADYMAREYANSPYKYTKEIGDKILSLFQYVRQMSDTDYFEAKPRRAVGLNEILRVLLPEGANARIANALDSKHIPYEFYKEGESRSSIIQKMDDVQFSRKDSEGNTLTEQQAEYFRDSKVRDENGNLLVVYHGTMTGDFTVFDASYANVEGDMGAGFYFTSDYADVDSNYEHGGRDFETKIERLAERIESDEDISYDEAKEKARKQLAKGEKLFEVYLDIKNPAYVGGNFDEATILSLDLDDGSLSVEDFESEDAYEEALWEAREESLQELYQKVESILEREGITGYEEWTGVLSPIGFFDGGTTITELKEALNSTLYDVYDENGNYAVNEVARAIVEALGYDGIIDNSVVDKWGYNSNRTNYMEGIDEETRHYIVFRPNQIKLTTNQTPTLNEDIRYSLKDKYFYQLTDGQIKKLLANSTKFKVYSKVEAEQIINNVLGNYMAFGDSYGELSGKSRREVIEMLWRGLNTADPGRQAKVALDVAEYIIQNAALENLYEDADNEAYIDTISILKPYLHKLDLSGIKGEIKYRYDRDNSPYLLWGKRRGQDGQTPDVVAMELAENGFYIESTNEADIFFEIDSAYRNAVQNLKRKARELLGDSLTKAERAKLKQDIAKEVLRGFDYTGKPSQLAKIVEKYAEQAKVWKQKYLEERSKNRTINRLLDKTQKLKDLKLGTFLNASQFKSDIFKGSIEKLAAIKYRGNLNESGTRKIVAGLAEWYSKDNPMLLYVDENHKGLYNEEVHSMLEAVATGEGNLTVTDVKMLDNIVVYFTHFVETYNKVYRNGKYVDAKPIAEKFIEVLRRNKNINVGILAKLFGKVFNNPKASYIQTFSDPMTVVRFMDRYDDGFYTDVLTRLREGAVNASVMEMEIREPLEEFYKKHKSYIKGLEKRTVQYQGKEIPVMQAMLLYMTLNREQALAGLAYSGFTYENGKETVRVEGFATDEGLPIEELKVLAQEQRDTLSKQFNETDKEYIGIAEKLFNEDCKEAKRKTDMQRKGYTNVLEDYYVPIRRANIAHSVDTSTFFDEMNRVSNASFNKDTVKGAKGELFIEALDSVLDRHIHAVSQYANLSSAIDEYDKLFNLDISDNPNKPTSVKTESADVWKKGDAYFKKLISDIQGIPVVKGEGSRAMAFIRSGYAKFQLGANPKVWVTQLSSFAAAGSILDVSSITKGIGINGNDVDEYCPLAKVRNNDNTVAMAQGVIDSVGKVGDVLMKPIGKVDRFVIKKLFGACQVQVEKNGGAKVGTKENKQAAGELLTKVILETQQNALATERSAAMRSGSEIMKTLTMFSSDAMKVIGRVIDSVGELSVLKHRRKSATDSAEIESLDKKIKAANTKVRKSVTALAVSAAFMALIAQLFRWLYNKDDEEDVGTTIAVDALGNLLGGLPIFKDIYARLVEGYDLDNYAYSALNDLLDGVQNIFDIATDIREGNTDDIAKNMRNILYALGQVFGIPVRNIYNVGYGLINRFSPSTAYKIDDMFYNKNYRSDLNKAIETDDDEMIATIVGVMLDENIGEITNSSARKELDKLTKAGYDVIPRAVSETITYDGEEMALTGRQVSQFKEVYSTAHEAVASLVSLSQYHSATEDVQAKAINFIYDVYYNLALEELLGVDLENKNILFAEAIDIEKLALIIATARAMTADTDDSGKAISGTRKAKIQSYINSLRLTAAQKYMIMGYLGYSNTMGETQVKSYINRLPLTSDEKTQLLQYSGYAA